MSLIRYKRNWKIKSISKIWKSRLNPINISANLLQEVTANSVIIKSNKTLEPKKNASDREREIILFSLKVVTVNLNLERNPPSKTLTRSTEFDIPREELFKDFVFIFLFIATNHVIPRTRPIHPTLCDCVHWDVHTHVQLCLESYILARILRKMCWDDGEKPQIISTRLRRLSYPHFLESKWFCGRVKSLRKFLI